MKQIRIFLQMNTINQIELHLIDNQIFNSKMIKIKSKLYHLLLILHFYIRFDR